MKLFILILIFIFSLQPAHCGSTICLWVWDYNQNLNRLKLTNVSSIAYLITTIKVKHNKISTIPRFTSLRIPKNIHRIAVLRIEIDNTSQLNNQLHQKILDYILAHFKDYNCDELQIDFDATYLQHNFYCDLINDLNNKYNHPISITALVSWVLNENWLDNLKIKFYVPMFFSMGSDSQNIINIVSNNNNKNIKKLDIIGISMNELSNAKILINKINPKRVFVFKSSSWNQKDIDKINQLCNN